MTANLEVRPETMDTALVQRAIDGDHDAFEELYQQNAASIFNLALRSTRDPDAANDVCQEVWLKVHRQIATLRAPGAFPAWLRRIAAHACVDMARQKARSRRDVCDTDASDLPDRSDLEADVAEQEDRRLAWQALAGLAPRQSAALYLREVEGLDYQSIGASIDASPSAVETLLFRARRSLARSYGTLKNSRAERCSRARSVMAAFVDNECTQVEVKSLHAHLESCAPCRAELESAQEVTRRYAALPFLPFAAPPLVAAAGRAGPSISHLVALAIAKIKSLLVPSIVVTSVTAGAMTLNVLPVPTLPISTPHNAAHQVALQTQVDPQIGSGLSPLSGLALWPDADQSQAAAASETSEPEPLVTLAMPTTVTVVAMAVSPLPPAVPAALPAPSVAPAAPPATPASAPVEAASLPSAAAATAYVPPPAFTFPPALPSYSPPSTDLTQQIGPITDSVTVLVQQRLTAIVPQLSASIPAYVAPYLDPALAVVQAALNAANQTVANALASVNQTVATVTAPVSAMLGRPVQPVPAQSGSSLPQYPSSAPAGVPGLPGTGAQPATGGPLAVSLMQLIQNTMSNLGVGWR